MYAKIGTFLSCGGGFEVSPPNSPSYGPDSLLQILLLDDWTLIKLSHPITIGYIIPSLRALSSVHLLQIELTGLVAIIKLYDKYYLPSQCCWTREFYFSFQGQLRISADRGTTPPSLFLCYYWQTKPFDAGTLKTRDWKTRDQIAGRTKGRTSVYGTRND